MNTCLNHPGEDLIVLRRWQAEAFKCATTGALMAFFDYWHCVKLKSSRQAKKINDIAAQHGDDPTQNSSLFQYHTLDELEDGLLGIGKRTKIKAAIVKLVGAGFLSKHTNPNPKYKFDKTIHYLFHPEAVNRYLDARNRAKLDWTNTTDREDAFSYSWDEYDRSWDEYDLAITEITPEITPEKKDKTPLPPEGDLGKRQDDLPAPSGQIPRPNLRPSSGSMIYGCYQGSSEFMDERPWMTKWHRANPKYVDGFPQAIMDYLKGIDDNPERVNLARAIGYLAAANKETPEGIERLQKIYAIWLEFSEGVGDAGLTDKQATAQILKHLDRLNATVVLDSSWAAPQGARLVSDLSGEHLNAYLKHLKSIPTPQEVSHAA